jgi:hypothetical protein
MEAMPEKTHQYRDDHQQDKVIEDTFPASDPPANSGVTGAEPAAGSSAEGDTAAKPTGTPTSDRHAAETAHHAEDDLKTTPGRM